MWAEVCPNGPSLAAVGETRAHERTTLHDDCDFGRLGILDPAIGRRITGHSIRTWALVPWLQEMSVSPDTMRDLLRALFLLYGWSDHPRLPSGLVLPRAPGTPPHPLDYAEVWTVHAGEIRDDGDILVTSTTTAGWSFALLDVLLRRPQGRIALFADASTSAEVVLRFAQMAQRADASLHLVVETDEPYLPYAALPVVIARAASPAAVQVNPSATLAELAPTIAAKLPCCGEGSPAQCPRECATVPLFADGFPPPRPAPDPFPDDDPDAGTPWPSAPSPAAPWHPVHVDADD